MSRRKWFNRLEPNFVKKYSNIPLGKSVHHLGRNLAGPGPAKFISVFSKQILKTSPACVNLLSTYPPVQTIIPRRCGTHLRWSPCVYIRTERFSATQYTNLWTTRPAYVNLLDTHPPLQTITPRWCGTHLRWSSCAYIRTGRFSATQCRNLSTSEIGNSYFYRIQFPHKCTLEV